MPRTRPPALLVLPLVSATAWLATAGTAQAHTALSSAVPADGGTVTEAPNTVTLDFSGTVRGPEVLVSDPDGAELTTGTASAEGSVVSVPVAVTASGVHTVQWSVTSADGHDLVGTTTFTVTLPEPAPATSTPTTSTPTTSAPTTSAPTTSAPTTSTPTTSAPTTSTPTTSAASPSAAAPSLAADEAEDGPNLLVRSVQTLLVLAVVAGVVLLIRRRRR